MARVSITSPRPRFRPQAEPLEDRTNPTDLIGQQGAFNSLNAKVGVDAPMQVIGESSDGRFLLIQTTATNVLQDQLTPPNQTNLFWYDVQAENFQMVNRYDNSRPGDPFANVTKGVAVDPSVPGGKLNAVISGDGQSVAFVSSANARNFDSSIPLANDPGGPDVFVWRAPSQSSTAGQANTITLASRNYAGFALGTASNPFISEDGKTVSFLSTTPVGDVIGSNANQFNNNGYTSVTPGIATGVLINDTGDSPDLFRADVGQTPFPVSFHTVPALYSKVITVTTNNGTTTTTIFDTFIVFQADGDLSVDPLDRYATAGVGGFIALRNNTNGTADPWRYRILAANTLPTAGAVGSANLQAVVPTTPVDRFPALGSTPGVSGLGTTQNAIAAYETGDAVITYKAFGPGGALVPGYVNRNNGDFDLYRVISGTGNIAAGGSDFIQLVSNKAGTTNVGSNGVLDLDPRGYQITRDGSKVVFTSKGTDHVAGLSDTNRDYDIFQKDVRNGFGGQTQAISIVTGTNRTGNRGSRFPSQADDSLVVAFESDATDLTPVPDTNGVTDVFARDLVANDTVLVSINSGNTAAGNGRSFAPVVSRVLPVNKQNVAQFYRKFQVFFSSTSTDLVEDATIPPGIAQLYAQQFPIFISQLSRTFAFSGGDNGLAGLAVLDRQGNVTNVVQFQPFPGWTGDIRVASADVNGDGVVDLIAGAGPGGGPRVVVIDGATGQPIYDFFAFEENFTGGVYVAGADLNGDGKAEIIVGAGEGGGPRVQVYDGATSVLLFDQFVFEESARTGVRVAAGDFNGDGIQDLFVSAGIGGGPRVRVFNGAALPDIQVMADFFAYEDSQRGGVYVSAGDFDGDGLADVAVGAGPGGGPRVTVFNAAFFQKQDPSISSKLADFFAFDPSNRDGAHVALRNLSGGKLAGLIVGTGSGFPRIRTFDGSASSGSGTPLLKQEFTPFSTVTGTNGAWVG